MSFIDPDPGYLTFNFQGQCLLVQTEISQIGLPFNFVETFMAPRGLNINNSLLYTIHSIKKHF